MTATLSNGRGWLKARAAASIARIDGELGHPLQITEAGRSWAQQKAHWDRYQHYLRGGPWAPIALRPGTSVHEAGEAIDSDEAQQNLGLMHRHGWRRTVYRNGRLVEPWHFEYFHHLDQHRGQQPAGSGGIPLPQPNPFDPALYLEDDMPIIIKRTDREEWSLLDPDVGKDLKPGDHRSERTNGGVVNTYRGFIVTTDKTVGDAWGRSYCRPWGNAPQGRTPDDYRAAQTEATRLAIEKHLPR